MGCLHSQGVVEFTAESTITDTNTNENKNQYTLNAMRSLERELESQNVNGYNDSKPSLKTTTLVPVNVNNNPISNKSAVNENNEQKLDNMKETEIMDTTNKDDKNILNKMVIDMKENLNKMLIEMEMQLKAMVNNDETVNELNDKIKILEQKLKDKQKDHNINMSSTQSNKIIEEIMEQTEINDDINNSVTNKSAVNEHNEQKLDIVPDTMKETEIMDTTNKNDKNILNKMVIDMKENLNKIVNNCILQLDIPTTIRENCISLAEKAAALTDMSSFTVPYTKIKLSKDSESCDIAQAAIQWAFEDKTRCSIKLNVWKQMKNDKLIEIDSKNVTEKECQQIVNNQVDEMINDIKRSML